MLFWHTGATIALARYAFRDDRMDLRMLVFGALLPDLIDTPIGILFYESLGSVRLVSHGLIVAAAVMVAVVLATRRGRPRKRWMPLAIGLFLHILLDALWLDPETLWWPFFGWGFSAAGPETVSAYLEALARNRLMWLGELVGLLYVAYLWRAAGLGDGEKRLAFLRTGRVDVPIDGDVTC
ncbi:MAG: metal-dependent hydrolase [Acidimicrobiia bacterium]|nr:metal-dependent hydrolase [Acidimicrobiia bacterium]